MLQDTAALRLVLVTDPSGEEDCLFPQEHHHSTIATHSVICANCFSQVRRKGGGGWLKTEIKHSYDHIKGKQPPYLPLDPTSSLIALPPLGLLTLAAT